MEIHEIIAAALGFSKVISGQNYMYHESQEDSQNGAISQVEEHLHLGAATNPKLKPILKFYSPIPCAKPQLKIVQGNTPQGAELMSRLEFKTISFKAEKNPVVLPNIKLLLQQSLTPWRLIKEEGSGDAKARKPRPTRNGLLSVIHQPLAGQHWVGRRHRVPEP